MTKFTALAVSALVLAAPAAMAEDDPILLKTSVAFNTALPGLCHRNQRCRRIDTDALRDLCG